MAEHAIFADCVQPMDMKASLHVSLQSLPNFFRSFFSFNQPLGYILWCVVLASATPGYAGDIVVGVSSATVCAGSSTTLTVSGCPATGVVRWSTAQSGTAITVSPVQATTYTALCEVTSTSVVSSTASSGTSVVTTVTSTSATATVQVFRPISVSLATQSVLCNGGSSGAIVVAASGGVGSLQFQLNNQPYQKPNSFTALSAGFYVVNSKDSLGCIVQASVQLTQPTALSAAIFVASPKCLGNTDGSATLTASGGVGGYQYTLGSGLAQSNGTFQNLSGNTSYTVVVSDKNGCVLRVPFTVTQPPAIGIRLGTVPTRCVGTTDGSISVTATNGSGIYQYKIGNGAYQTGARFTGLSAGGYSVSVQDGNGCVSSQTVVVGQPDTLKVLAQSRPVTCLGPNTGSIVVSAKGGTGSVTYQLSTGATPQSVSVISGIAVGNYTVIGTDANGCTGFTSVTIGKVDPLKVQPTIKPASCCICPTGAITLTSTGGTGTGLQVQLIGQSYLAGNLVGNLAPNTYRLRAKDDGGCVDSTVAIVTDGTAMSLSVASITNVSCPGKTDGAATVQVTGGTKPITYFWTTEKGDTLKTRVAVQTGLAEGTYTVSVRDSNRCSAPTVFVTLKTANPTPATPVISQLNSSTLVVNQTAGIQWYVRNSAGSDTPVTNGTNPTLIPFLSGQYYVIVTQNGCASAPSNLLNFVLTGTEPLIPLSVQVIPNPITDRLRLQIDQPERSALDVWLLDATGRLVRSYQVPAFTGNKQLEWPMAGVSAGAYLLKVSTETRQSVLRVLVE